MAKPSVDRNVDGQLEAVRLLRALQRLNWNRNQPRKSRAALIAVMQASNTWPPDKRERFASVIAGWLTDMAFGCVPDLDDWERASHAKAMRTDAGFHRLMAKVTG